MLLAPKDGDELVAMLRWAHVARQQDDRAAGYLIRYPKDEIPALAWEHAPIVFGKAEILHRASAGTREERVMIWAYGMPVKVAWEALEELGEAAARVTLVNARFAKPMDGDLLAELAEDHATVLSAEDHALPGGFGSVVAETILDRALPLTLHRMGVKDELIPHAGRDQQLADQGLSRAGIAARLRRLLGLKRDDAIPFTRTG